MPTFQGGSKTSSTYVGDCRDNGDFLTSVCDQNISHAAAGRGQVISNVDGSLAISEGDDFAAVH